VARARTPTKYEKQEKKTGGMVVYKGVEIKEGGGANGESD
jgi:hypothetical protein